MPTAFPLSYGPPSAAARLDAGADVNAASAAARSGIAGPDAASLVSASFVYASLVTPFPNAVRPGAPCPADTHRGVRQRWTARAVLAVAAALGAVSCARPIAAPPDAAPPADALSNAGTLPTDAATAPAEAITRGAPTGRLIYIVPGGEGDPGAGGEASAHVMALDLRTGATQPLWEAPGSHEGAQWAVSPDGTRLAFARAQHGEIPGILHVRHLEPDAPGPLVSTGWDAEGMAPGAGVASVDGLVWSPDGTGLYAGVIFFATPDDAVPAFLRWELHHVALDERALAAYDPPPTVGPLGWGINVGASRLIARIEPEAIGPRRMARLLAVDVSSQRAAVAIGPGENGTYDAIGLIDLTTGDLWTRVPLGITEGFGASASRDGSRIAYLEWTGSDGHTSATLVRVLSLADDHAAPRTIAALDPPVPLGTPVWLHGDRWLAWDAGGRLLGAPVDGAGEAVEAVGARRAPPGGGARWAATDAGLLVDSGLLVDFETAAEGVVEGAPLAWSVPDGDSVPPRWAPAWLEHAIGWAPDVDRVAVGAMATATAASAAERIAPLATVAVPPDPDDVSAGPVLEVGPWSPDGRWLPVWTGRNWSDGSRGDAALGFLDARAGTLCAQPDIVRASHADAVFWTADGRVHVRIDGRVAAGVPCAVLAPEIASAYALPTAAPGETPSWAEHPGTHGIDAPGPEDSAPSPDGGHLATTSAAGDGSLDYITRIARAADGVVVAEARWQGGDRLGDMGLGGAWLPTGDLLISRSDDRGPLLVRPSGEVAQVADRLFGLEAGAYHPAVLTAHPVIRDDGGWHLLLTGAGGVRVYHAETGDVERLPSDSLWSGGISQDGRWLLLHGRHGAGGSPAGLWIRPLEDRAAAFRLIPGSVLRDASWAPESPDGRRLAFVDADAGTVSVVSFPEGDVVGRWQLDGYLAGSAGWAPDGQSIAIDGYTYGPDDGAPVVRALFLVDLRADP